jgi:hypothetical protein
VWSQLAPREQVGELASIAVDAVLSRRERVLENAVLRHQVNVLRRGSKRPKLHCTRWPCRSSCLRARAAAVAAWSPSSWTPPWRALLAALGLPCTPATFAPARDPPQAELWFDDAS